MTELKSSKTKLDHLVDGIIRDVCELPDYNSPDDQPELLQATCSELEAILRNRLGVETAGEHDPRCAANWGDQCNCETATCQFHEEAEACFWSGCPNEEPTSPSTCPLPWPRVEVKATGEHE